MQRLIRTVVLIATLATGIGFARAGTFAEDCDAARAGRHEALVGLAEWCHENRLYATRNGLAELILAVDPGHTPSRLWLKHRLVAGGQWEKPPRPAVASDRNAEALSVLPEERARRLGGVARGLLAAIEAHAETLPAGDREAVLAEVLDLTPDDEAVRREHGDVRTANGWVLLETLTGVERRMDLRHAAKAALKEAEEPRKTELPEAARRASLRWKGCWETPSLQVAVTTTESEARSIIRGIEAVPDYLRVALGDNLFIIPGLTIYVMPQRSEAQTLIDAHPETDDRTREHWDSFAAYWIGRVPHYMTYHESGAWRLEGCVSQQVSWDLAQRYGIRGDRAAWASVGFEKRLVWELVGTRITYTRRISEYAEQDVPWASWGELTDRGWFERAREVLAACGPADLMEIFGKPLNLLTLRDEVVAQAVAAYYVEGRPEECHALLSALGSGENADDAFARASGLDVEALRLRLVRWLDERRP